MTFFEALMGALLLGAAFVGWIVFQRKMQGDERPLFGPLRSRKQKEDGPNELEAFISAYRSGQIDPAELRDTTAAAASPPPMQPAAQADEAEATAFIRPAIRLAYLTVRAGLPDHHAFANVHLSDLGRGNVPGRVDLLVFDSRFSPVAAIDVDAGAESETAKLAFLRETGIRYLRFSGGSMPRAADLHTLIYRA